MASDSLRISASDMPAVFRAADTASNTAQRNYLRLVRADVSLIVVSALSTAVAVSSRDGRVVTALIGAGCLLTGLILTGLIIRTGYDRRWFQTRAVAESSKTMAWRYMTGAEPYPSSLPEPEADERFCREIDAVLQERRAIGGFLGGSEGVGEQITEAMRKLRLAPLETRCAIYVRDRIQDQREWYSSKAEENSDRSDAWLYAVAASQLAGAGAAVALVRWPEIGFNAAGVLAVLAAALMAWLQLKQHQELASSYALAAHELGLVESRARHVQTEQALSDFVSDAENAISREHTMWVARRDVLG